MKLLLLNSIGRTKWGGGEKWMLMTAKNLISRGHEVYIGCARNSILEKNSLDQNIPVLAISIHSDFSLLGLLKLKKYYLQIQFDAIIGCQNRDVRIAGFLIKKIVKSNCIVYSRQGVQLLNGSIKYKYTFAPFCDGIITNTTSIKREYDSYGWWNGSFVKVIHNGVEMKTNSESFDYSQYINSELGKPFIILSSGRLSKQKGFKYLIEAAKEVIDKKPNVYFFIAGEGKLKNELQEQINDNNIANNVFLLGFKTNVASLLNGADLFVLSSLFEGMPNALMEAMAVGKPVISTNVNGVTELMQNGKHGLIIEAANSNAISSSIIKMIEEKNYCEMGIEGKKHVADHFSVDKMVDEIESFLLQKIAAQK
nr:glycosyltransferase [uncultured Carboxylicivirga sp.]